MSLIRFEEGKPPVCPKCFGEDVDSLGTCADCDRDDEDERAHERMLEQFYGDSVPVTDRERHVAAWKARR